MNKKATENSWQQHKQEQIVLGQTACHLNEMTVVRGELPVSFYLGFSEAFDSDIYRICIVKLKRQDGWTAVWVVSSWTAVYEAQEPRQHLEGALLKSATRGCCSLTSLSVTWMLGHQETWGTRRMLHWEKRSACCRAGLPSPAAQHWVCSAWGAEGWVELLSLAECMEEPWRRQEQAPPEESTGRTSSYRSML